MFIKFIWAQVKSWGMNDQNEVVDLWSSMNIIFVHGQNFILYIKRSKNELNLVEDEGKEMKRKKTKG